MSKTDWDVVSNWGKKHPIDRAFKHRSINLTIALVVLGGSRSYNHDNPQDIDYFGYHEEETPKNIHVNSHFRHISSSTITSVVDGLEGKYGWYYAVYPMDDWMFHPVMFETNLARTFREEYIRPLLQPEFAKYYAIGAIGNYTASKNIQQGKIWNRAIRMALTAKHLLSTGELNCDFKWLKNKYSITTLEDEINLSDEIKALF